MKTSRLQEVLIAQADNLRSYPNISRESFTTLERELQQSWNYTYGIKTTYNGTDYVFNGWGEAPDGLVVSLVVLAVHGTKLSATVKNTGSQANNEIFLMSKSWLPPEANDKSASAQTITMTLNTVLNRNVTVTMNSKSFVKSPGVFMVNEDLIEDIGINSYPITDKPVLTYTYRKRT